MALGKTNNQDNGKLLVLRIQNKTTDPKTGVETPLSPYQFEISEKIDGRWTVRPELESRVSGHLSKIQIEDKEYEGNPYKAFKFYLNDPDSNETYLLDLRSTMVSRNLFNSLLALESFDNLQVSLYNKTSKKDNKDYTNVSLWQGENMVKGKYSLDELPKPEEIKNKQGKLLMRKYDELDEFFAKHLTELNKKISGKPSPKNEAKKTEPKTSQDAGELTDDRVPF
jgi:hypothetical protein